MSNRDWPEDAEHENGRYTCLCVDCGQAFIGHKRRVVCKDCAFASAPPSPDRYREGLEAAAKVAEKYDQNDFTVAGRFVIAAAIRSLTPPAPDASGGRDGAAEERARVVAWLRERAKGLGHIMLASACLDLAADGIEAGDHLPKIGGSDE